VESQLSSLSGSSGEELAVESAANQSGVDISRTRAADHEPRWDGTAISSTMTGHEPEKGRL